MYILPVSKISGVNQCTHCAHVASHLPGRWQLGGRVLLLRPMPGCMPARHGCSRPGAYQLDHWDGLTFIKWINPMKTKSPLGLYTYTVKQRNPVQVPFFTHREDRMWVPCICPTFKPPSWPRGGTGNRKFQSRRSLLFLSCFCSVSVPVLGRLAFTI